eukprot:5540357-Ditylum_brightwellii.AAC.1
MIDLSTSGLRRSTQEQTVPQHYEFLTMLLGASAVLWTNLSTVSLTLQNRATVHAEVATALHDNTINLFSPMAFAANQQQNKTYMYRDMLKQPDCKDFIVAILEEVSIHEDRNDWTSRKFGE